jgi:small subunit ribosomal protein S1
MRDLFDDDNSDDNGSSDFARMFEDSLTSIGRKLSVGDKVRGEVLSIGKEEVFVSTGTVDDGVVLRTELLGKDGAFSTKVGDFLDLFVVRVQGNQILLSPKPTSKNMADGIEDAFDLMVPVDGVVTEVCNGGFRVNVMGKTAFCPISQMDLRRIDDASTYIGKKFEFMITQFSERGRNIVVSRRKILEEQRELTQASFAEDHKPGQTVRGVITRIEKFGAFIEIAPGMEGLCHISELGWTRVSDPSEVVRIGQEVEAKILKIDDAGSRLNVSLSLKESGADPWVMITQQYPQGSVLQGRVERREPYGLFVKITDGIVGLLPKGVAMENPNFNFDRVKVGDDITVEIVELRLAERRISLTVPMDPEAGAWKGFNAPGGAGAVGGNNVRGKALGTLGEQFKTMFEAQVGQAPKDGKGAKTSIATKKKS